MLVYGLYIWKPWFNILINLSSFCNRPPKTCCVYAIKLLETAEAKRNKIPFPSEKDYWCAHVYFLLYLYEMQERQAASGACVI